MFLLKNIVVTAPADTINTVLTLDATDFLGVVAVGISAGPRLLPVKQNFRESLVSPSQHAH